MSLPSERIVSLYQRHATDWDKERGRSLFEKDWLERFLALLPQTASILDIGCGAGEPIARYLIEMGCHVTGIDSSSALIDLGRNRFPDQEWLVRDKRTLSLERVLKGSWHGIASSTCPRMTNAECSRSSAVTPD
jgi:SAM-dependent methyltransferase